MGRGGWASPTCRIQYYKKKYSPTKTVRVSRTPTKGQEPGVVQTRQNSGFVRSLVKRVGTVAYISNGVEHSTAVQYGITESYEDTISHFPDKKSERGGWERRGALAGFHGTTGDILNTNLACYATQSPFLAPIYSTTWSGSSQLSLIYRH